MNFKYILILFVILSFSNVCGQTEGRITYRIITDNSSLNDKVFENQKDFKNLMNSLDGIRDNLNFYLDFKNEASTFYVDRSTNLGLSNKKGYHSTIESFKTYYRNVLTKTLITIYNNDKVYLVTSNTDDIIWTITNEQKKIGNYLCTKATTIVIDKKLRGIYKKAIEAWFCPEIPIGLGPNNYGGLPGLILELKDNLFTYYVTKMDFNFDNDLIINKPEKGKAISKEAYFDLIPTINKENFKEYISN